MPKLATQKSIRSQEGNPHTHKHIFISVEKNQLHLTTTTGITTKYYKFDYEYP